MKKPINLIKIGIVAILVIGLIVGTVFLILHFKNKKASDNDMMVIDTTNFDLLRLTKLSEVKKYAEDNKLNFAISDDYKIGAISEITLVDNSLNLSFYTDDSDDLVRVNGQCVVTAKTVEELNESISTVSNAVGRFFELDYTPYYAIYASDGSVFESDVENPVTELFAGNVKFTISVIDQDGTFWNLSILKTTDNTFIVEFLHSFEKGVYEDGSEAINLAIPKE